MGLERPLLYGHPIKGLPVAQAKVIQWVCDRCETQELRPYQAESDYKTVPVLTIEFGGQITRWSDLCESCTKTVSNYLANILKAKKGKGPEEPDPLPSPTATAPTR